MATNKYTPDFSEEDKSAWDMREKYLHFLSFLMTEIGRATIKNNIVHANNCLTELHDLIYTYTQKNTNTLIDEALKQLRRKIYTKKELRDKIGNIKTIYPERNNNTWEELRNIKRLIYTEMDKRNLIIPRQENKNSPSIAIIDT